MTKKGFTLVELLATLVILSILMTVAVSAVLRVVDTSRKDNYAEDAKKFISKVEYSIRAGNLKIAKPKSGSCIVVGLNYIDNLDFKKAPSGGHYDYDSSFVLLKNQNFQDVFYVRLLENLSNSSSRGISIASQNDLKGSKGRNKVVGVKADDKFIVNSTNASKLKSLLPSGYCSSITFYVK